MPRVFITEQLIDAKSDVNQTGLQSWANAWEMGRRSLGQGKSAVCFKGYDNNILLQHGTHIIMLAQFSHHKEIFYFNSELI